MYSVKVRVGSECKEKPVALFKDETVTFEPIVFSSPAPLEGTAKTHKFQTDHAETNSTEVHVRKGEGSQIYIFVRNWTEKTPSVTNKKLYPDAAIGLTLRSSKDEVLVDFGSPDVGSYSYDWDPWSACNVQLDPGAYCLCLKTYSGKILKQTIIASPGWQTQVFLLQRNYGFIKKDAGENEMDVRADLSNASIFMSRIGYGFQSSKPYEYSDNPDFRLTEMARQALINNRHVLNKEVMSRMLSDKFGNPMLGIYGVHLLLLSEKADKSILPDIVNNLRGLLVQPHPDVEAIALKLNVASSYVFDTPPMLRLSWNYVIEASVKQPQLVPQDSLAATIAGKLCSGDPWLLWGYLGKQADNTTILFEQLKKLTELEEASIDTTNLAPDQLMSAKMDMPLETANADTFSMPQIVDSDMQSIPPERSINDEKMLHMVQALGVPRSVLEVMLKSLDKNTADHPATGADFSEYRETVIEITERAEVPVGASKRDRRNHPR